MAHKNDLSRLSAKRTKWRKILSDKHEIKKGLGPKTKPGKRRIPNNSWNNHRKPNNFTRNSYKFTNSLSRFGMTDEETKEFYKTGKFPERIKNKDK